MIDEGFIKRTYKTSVIVWAIATLGIVAGERWYAALGFTLGAAVSMGVLASLSHIVRRLFVPGQAGAGRTLIKFGIVKLVAIAVIVTGVVMTRRYDLIFGFCGGVILTQAVMFLKAIGITLNERMGQ